MLYGLIDYDYDYHELIVNIIVDAAENDVNTIITPATTVIVNVAMNMIHGTRRMKINEEGSKI